jgi:hypothetical protein
VLPPAKSQAPSYAAGNKIPSRYHRPATGLISFFR